MRRLCLLLSGLLLSALTLAQPPDPGRLYIALQKLNTLGSVLYIAAHPDDENTSLISTLSNGMYMRTAYLSLTRGDGGQNLIGPEQNEVLGIIRTQELLAARKIDGGEQYFTRAVDFGYSKTAEETFNFWGREKILEDMVWVIRRFRPDVIITRFPPSDYQYETHGHHAASAVLTEEAYQAAADPKRFPEQLQSVQPWKAKRLYWNTSRWFYQRTGQQLDAAGKLLIDMGEYDPLLGQSYAALAARARSMHKSQGFGASPYLGSLQEYLQYVAGDKAESSLFEGVDVTWKRVKGGEKVQPHIVKAIEQFDFKNPSSVLPHLLLALEEVNRLGDDSWVEVKRTELVQLIIAIAGIHIEANAKEYYATPGSSVDITVSLVNGSGVSVGAAAFGEGQADGAQRVPLGKNQLVELKQTISIAKNTPVTQPYWLRTSRAIYGRFEVADVDAMMNGEAWDDPALSVQVVLGFNGKEITTKVPVTYKWTDRVKGEQVRPFIVMPDVTAEFDERCYVFPDSAWKDVRVTLKAWAEDASGGVTLTGAKGWKLTPSKQTFSLAKGEEATFTFRLGPPSWSAAYLAVAVNGELAHTAMEIKYDHIPHLVWLPHAGAIVSSADIKADAKRIGYIMGAGDDVANGLRQLGCELTMITKDNFDQLDLTQFDAIVAGVRAYNTETWLPAKHKRLMSYVEQGGNYVVQYMTTAGLLQKELGPYPFKVGRGRVTDESSPVGFRNREHPILTKPNMITPFDFNGWVQERGLYFGEDWDSRYETVLVMNDPGEDMNDGSLLVTHYGKGTFIYTGISFFRQIPIGVSGAYRLLANVVSYRQAGNE